MKSYEEFVAGKIVPPSPTGFTPPLPLSERLFDFQAACVQWALERGSAALFEDPGLGKTFQEAEWARQVCEQTKGQVLIVAPLAVAQQTVREGDKFGIPIRYAIDQGGATEPITVTNYERLAGFDASRFAGVVLDESSILKAYSGKVKQSLVAMFAQTPYRLCGTATPAPNDLLELGNHAEFLGILTSHEMIARWFLPDTSTFGTYRLKGHAIQPYWDWVSSWARCLGKPSDLGPDYSDEGYDLPELVTHQHVVEVDLVQDRGDTLFRMPALSATAVHKEKRITAGDRAAKVAELVAAEPRKHWLVWCDTDYEADALVKAIPGAVEVRGSHKPDFKERAALWFSGEEVCVCKAKPCRCFGRARILISKPSVFGFGLNFQHCSRVAFVGATFSFEQFYQAIRRCWRFGQEESVHAHVVMASTEVGVWSVLQGKAAEHDVMKAQMLDAMRRATARTERHAYEYNPGHQGGLPRWLVEGGQHG